METETPAVTPTKAARRARAGKPDGGNSREVPGSGVWFIRYVDAQGRYRREKAGTWGKASTGCTTTPQYTIFAKAFF